MPKEIGPHLLGRIPSPPDTRDYQLENFLNLGETSGASDQDLASLATSELKLTTVTYKRWAATKYTNVEDTHWWKAFNALSQISPVPTPPPTPDPSGAVSWQNPEPVLDQGDYGTCVGNGEAQFGNTLPIDDKFNEKDARAIYYEATVLDGSPDDPDAEGGGQQGATVRSGMQAMKNRSRIASYAQSTNIDTLKQWVLTKGPIVIGSDWMNDMFNPDSNGFVKPTGGYAGGHCFLWLGYDPTADVIEFLNSWGDSWAKNGHFFMRSADFEKLLSAGGEAYTAVELALA